MTNALTPVLLTLLHCCGAADDLRRAIVDVSGNQAVDSTQQYELFDHNEQPLSAQPKMASFNQRCQQAVRRAVADAAEGHTGPIPLYPDPLFHVTVAPRASPDDPRIVYFIMVARDDAYAAVQRLISAFYHPSQACAWHVARPAQGPLPSPHVPKPATHHAPCSPWCISPLYLPYISPTSRSHLACISSALPGARGPQGQREHAHGPRRARQGPAQRARPQDKAARAVGRCGACSGLGLGLGLGLALG